MSIIEYLINKFAADEIEVILKFDQVIFRCGNDVECLAPIVYLAKNLSEYRVLSVGNAPKISQSYIRVNLFDGEEIPSEDFDKSDVLESFFHYGFSKLISRTVFVRPRVRLVFGEGMSNVFGGYRQAVLMKPVANAGAREVVFSSKVK